MAQSGIAQRMLQARLDLAQRLGREVGKAEIAERAGIPAPTYGRYESGVRKLPSELVAAVAAALQVDVAKITGEATPAAKAKSHAPLKTPEEIFGDAAKKRGGSPKSA